MMDRIQLLLEEYKQQSADWWHRDKYVQDKFIRCVFFFSIILAVTAGMLAEYQEDLFTFPYWSKASAPLAQEPPILIQEDGTVLVIAISDEVDPAHVGDLVRSIQEERQPGPPYGLLVAFAVGYAFLAFFSHSMVLTIVKDTHYRDGSELALRLFQKKIEEHFVAEADPANPADPESVPLPSDVFRELAEAHDVNGCNWDDNGDVKCFHQRKLLAKPGVAAEIPIRGIFKSAKKMQEKLSEKSGFSRITRFYWLFYQFTRIAAGIWVLLLVIHLVGALTGVDA